MIRQTRRPGVTLIEALMAIFIMAVGLISLLALLPVGALQMAKSFRWERTSQLASNADNLARTLWRYAWIDQKSGVINSDNQAFLVEQSLKFLDDPQPGLTPPVPTNSTAPSWPLFIDPIGYILQPPANIPWVAGKLPANAGGPPATIPRQTFYSPMLGANSGLTGMRVRATTLLDDIGFSRTGGGRDPATGQVERGGKFNCAWLIQRLRNDVRHEANLHVVVYQGRPPTDLAANETAYAMGIADNPGNYITADGLTTSLTINTTTNGRPKLKRDGWVLVCFTYDTTTGEKGHVGEFYRVVGFSEPQGQPGQIQIELQTPIRRVADQTSRVQFPGWVVVMENVVEVFDRGTLSPTAPPAP